MTLYEFIKTSPDLSAMAATGHDGGIEAALNAVDPAIVVPRDSIPADSLRAMAIAASMTAAGLGDAAKIARWQAAVAASSGFRDPIPLTDPVLVIQLSAAEADGVLYPQIKNHYCTRPGSIAEREWGRAVTVSEISQALLIDRPDGLIQTQGD